MIHSSDRNEAQEQLAKYAHSTEVQESIGHMAARNLHQFGCPLDCDLDHTEPVDEPDYDAHERALDEVLDADEREGIQR